MSSTSTTILEGQDIKVVIDGKPLLHNVSITLAENSLIGLIGPNGAGKSTLINILAGLQQTQSGQVTLDGKRLQHYSGRERAQWISWLEQQGKVHWPINVRRLVSLGRLPHQSSWHTPDATVQQAIETAMAETDCLHLSDRQFSTLSGGEQARVLMARALAATPRVLLADEPIAALDPGHQLQTMQLLRRFANNGKACIAVLHELSLAARYCDSLFLMDQGQLVDQGDPGTVLTDENLKRVYGIKAMRGDQPVPWIVPYELSAR